MPPLEGGGVHSCDFPFNFAEKICRGSLSLELLLKRTSSAIGGVGVDGSFVTSDCTSLSVMSAGGASTVATGSLEQPKVGVAGDSSGCT